MKYFLEIDESGDRIPVGDICGYDTIEEARKEALERLYDDMPCSFIRIFQCVAEVKMARRQIR